MANEMSQEAGGKVTREDLFPEGWEEKLNKLPPEAVDEEYVPPKEEGEGEDLAEARDQEQETEEQETTPEGVLGRMEWKDFLKAAGVSHEEGYRDIYMNLDGEEVSISKLLDDRKAFKDANAALLRERTELQERVNKASSAVPQQGGVSPEAQQMMAQRQLYMQELTNTDWSQFDAATAANRKIDLQNAANALYEQAQLKQMEWQNQQQEQVTKAMAEADRQTRARIPEWGNTQVAVSEWKAIKDMGRAYGFSDAEMDAVTSPNLKHLLRDAWMAMSNAKKIAEGAKKVRRVSKTLGAGGRAAQPNKPNLKEVRESIKAAETRDEKQKLRLTLPLG